MIVAEFMNYECIKCGKRQLADYATPPIYISGLCDLCYFDNECQKEDENDKGN